MEELQEDVLVSLVPEPGRARLVGEGSMGLGAAFPAQTEAWHQPTHGGDR